MKDIASSLYRLCQMNISTNRIYMFEYELVKHSSSSSTFGANCSYRALLDYK